MPPPQLSLRVTAGVLLLIIPAVLTGLGAYFIIAPLAVTAEPEVSACATERSLLLALGCALLVGAGFCCAAFAAALLWCVEQSALVGDARCYGDHIRAKAMSLIMPGTPNGEEAGGEALAAGGGATALRCERWRVQLAALLSGVTCLVPTLLFAPAFIVGWTIAASIAVAGSGAGGGCAPLSSASGYGTGTLLSVALYAVVPLIAASGVVAAAIGVAAIARAISQWPAFCTPALPNLTLASPPGAIGNANGEFNVTRFVAVSDTHGALSASESAKLPGGDVLVHCGDFTKNGSVAEIVAFNAWLGTLPHANKIVIGGNHDLAADEFDRYTANRVLMRHHHHYAHLPGSTHGESSDGGHGDGGGSGGGDGESDSVVTRKCDGSCCGRSPFGWITALIFSPDEGESPYSLALEEDDDSSECGPDAMRALFTNATYLVGEACVAPGGATIFGAPWQPAIPTDFTPTEERHPMAAFVRSVDERRVLWGDVPAELDVLLTHAPPRGVLDALLSDDSHVGCLLLAERLAELHRASAGGSGGAPRWHIFGHIHEARGVEIGARLGGEDLASTTFVNAASVNMIYRVRPSYGAVAFDVVPRGGATAASARFARAAEDAAATGRVQLVAAEGGGEEDFEEGEKDLEAGEQARHSLASE